MTTTFGVSQDDYLRRMVSSSQILMTAVFEIREEADRCEALSCLRIHNIAQAAIERVTKL